MLAFKNKYFLIIENIKDIELSNIKLTNKHHNNISFIQEHLHNNKKYPNIRFISTLFQKM